MKQTVGGIARAVRGQVLGDESMEVTGLASIRSASPGDLVFVEEARDLASALHSHAAAVIAGSFAAKERSSKPLVIAAHPRLAFARAAALFGGESERLPEIDPRAVILPSATIAASAIVDPWTFVGRNAVIGNGTWVGAGSVIGTGVVIGQECKIYPRVSIYPGTRMGDRVVVHAGAVLGSDGFGYVRDPTSGRYEKFPQLGRLHIEDDVEIGANATIDRGALEITRIGRGTKIDNLVHIGHNCNLGENVIVAAQAGFSGSVVIEDNVVVGGQVGIGEHAHLQEGVLLGGQAGVLPKKVLRGKGVPFWGTPAKPLREYLKSLAALARLGRKE